MVYPKALATLDAILELAKVRLYDQGRDDEHAIAGTMCAAKLHDLGLPVRFISMQDGFCVEIEHPSTFYSHPGVECRFGEIPGDTHFSEVGGGNPILMAFYDLDHYQAALIRTMGDPRELRIPVSAFAAFARAAESWRPANSDHPLPPIQAEVRA